MPPTDSNVGFTVDVTKLRAKVKRILAEIELRQLLSTIGQRQLNWIGKNLQAAGAPPSGDGLWAEMAASTIKRRPQRQSNRHFSSRYQALLQQSPVMRIIESSGQVEVGTNAKYSRFHHEGASRGRWRLPARKLLPSEERQRQLAMSVIDALHARITLEGNR